ncbi:MAG TPA: HEAT repeat domain-containing protein [Vicinamibacterales bacterium]|nr:HEAT repeat domain-containing protein [Vicinamibacterales bacterium]
MTRLAPFAGILMLVPMLAAAQTPPPAPPPRPAEAPRPPAVAPVAPLPVPPEPPSVIVAPPVIDRLAIEDAVRAAQVAAQSIDTQAIREAAERAREEADRAREQAQEWRFQMPELRMDLMGWQDRGFAFAGQDSESSTYSSGLSLLGQRQFDQAIVRFDRTISQKGTHADGALYWKAFAQYKLGKGQDALETIGTLRKDYPQSRYLNDAKVLEADVKKPAVGAIDDDDIKLLAIQGIMNSDPVRGAQLCETVLTGTNSLALKRRALYLLALSDQPRAHEVVLSYAKGSGNPDLQREAISYLATRRSKQPTTAADMRQIYESTTDLSIKRAIIDAYRTSGDKSSLITIVQSGAPTELRSRAVSNLTDLAAPQELWTLYQKEPDKDLRIAMVRAFSSMGAVDQLLQIAKTDKEPVVRQQAVRSLGSQKVDKTGSTLVEMYSTEQDKDAKMAIISALANQNNDTGLVAIARKETTNIELKREIVRRLAEMSSRSKVAADYLLEVIK